MGTFVTKLNKKDQILFGEMKLRKKSYPSTHTVSEAPTS